MSEINRINGGKRYKITYEDIRKLRPAFSWLTVKDFCTKFEISEQSFYRAMRKGK